MIKSIDLTKLVATERQWVKNGIAGLDEYNKTAVIPLKKLTELNSDEEQIPTNWGKYVDTYTTKTYQLEIFEKYLFYKDFEQQHEWLLTGATKNIKKALYEKTLQGNAFIVLYNNSTLSYVIDNIEYPIKTEGIAEPIIDITYAFNRLIATTASKVVWSEPGLNPQKAIDDGQSLINGSIDFKQSDTITQDYLGTYTDFVNLYLFTKGGFEVWTPTQDTNSPFIYQTSKPCKIVDFENEFALMEDDSHRLGLFSAVTGEWLTDERWYIARENFIDLKMFTLEQNNNKVLAVYEKDIMQFYDLKYGLITKCDIFYPWYRTLEEYNDLQINLLIDKGVYSSLFLQLGQFPEEIQFYLDNFYIKRGALVAFARDDVIKTMNIGKLTVDTNLELNFKGKTAIYSLGIDLNGG